MGSSIPVEKQRSVSRRDFLDLAVLGAASLTAVGIGLPALAYIWPPAEVTKRAGERVKVAEPAEIAQGKAKTVLLNGKPVLVINTGDSLVALTATCPHLGCVVKWNDSEGKLDCPCHGAVFDTRGNVLSGPSPSPLASIPVTRAKDGIYLG